MNKIKKYLFCMIVACLVLPSAVYADYFCDFESGADEWVCTPFSFTYDSDGTVMKGVGIVSDPENAENKVLLIDGTPGRASAKINFENIHGKIEISFKVRFDNMSTNVFNYAGVSSADGLVISPMIHNEWFIYRNAGGELIYTDGADPKEWLEVRYLIDTEALTYSAYVKGGMYKTEKQMAKNFPLGKQAIAGINSFSSTANDAQIYIDNVKITKLGESDAVSDVWVYSNNYIIDYDAKTIGNLRYKTPKSVLYSTLVTKPDVSMQISGEEECFLGGEILTLRNSKTGTEQTYSIKVRTDSITKLYDKVLKDTNGIFPPYFRDAFLIK